MGYEEFLASALARGRLYEQLPAALQSVFSYAEYQVKVKEYWISKGAAWADSPAQAACGEAEYYQDLLKKYKQWMRVFPYHLANYVCRIMRITPFKYYQEMLIGALINELPYHQVPNFAAADALRVLGVGRNEYIAIMNACKGRTLLWRINRTSVAKENLPNQPLDVNISPWWKVMCVNLGDAEFRELDVDELAVLKSAGTPGSNLVAGEVDKKLLMGLWKKGLVYYEIPIQPQDRFRIPPLEGFVSNKDAAQPLGGGKATPTAADPMEALLYAVFVANSERLTVDDLAGILGQGLPEVSLAISLACRLGFATRVNLTGPISKVATTGDSELLIQLNDDDEASGHGLNNSEDRKHAMALADELIGGRKASTTHVTVQGARLQYTLSTQQTAEVATPPAAAADPFDGRAVAVVLDAEATSFLMMGALSPGLKRHAVTLFEGGRVAGEATLSELTSELWASHAEGEGFEGDMARLAQFAGSLATALDIIRTAAGPGLEVELLRKESLAGLQPASAAKVLATAYCALLPVTPLPHPPLPLALGKPDAPAYFGPTAATMSPWMLLALYQAAGCGPNCVALVSGQRLTSLPPQLQSCSHAIIWVWDPETDAPRAKSAGLPGAVIDGGACLVDAAFLLYSINELLTRTAVLVAPIRVEVPANSCTAQQVQQASAFLAKAQAQSVLTGSPSFRKSLDRSRSKDTTLNNDDDEDGEGSQDMSWLGCVVDIPLPLAPDLVKKLEGIADGSYSATGNTQNGTARAGVLEQYFDDAMPVLPVRGVIRREEKIVEIQAPVSALQALQDLGLATCTGSIRMIQMPGQQVKSRASTAQQQQVSVLPSIKSRAGSETSSKVHTSEFSTLPSEPPCEKLEGSWLPMSLHLGVPLYCLPLCKLVCLQAREVGCLSLEGQQRQISAQHSIQAAIDWLYDQYAAENWNARPITGPGGKLVRLNSMASQRPTTTHQPFSAIDSSFLVPQPSLAAGHRNMPQLSSLDMTYSKVHLPVQNLVFENGKISVLDLRAHTQGCLPLFLGS